MRAERRPPVTRDGGSGGGQNDEMPAQREGRHVISRANINNTNLREEFKEDPRTREFR